MPVGVLLKTAEVEQFSEAPAAAQVKQPHLSNADVGALALFTVCATIAFATMVMLLVNLHKGIKEKTSTVPPSSQIPCRNCQFFTDSHYLRCTVHPTVALTEQAIDCCDYKPNQHR